MEQQHAIGKLLLEVQLPSREEAFALQGALSTRCTTELEPLLAELLDSWADPDTLLQIDKLEIDLGACDMETLRKELPEMVISYLRKHYQGMQAQLSLEAGMQRVPLRQGYYESWLYFLEHGVLPVAAVKGRQEEWEAGILEALSSETHALQQCRTLLATYPYAIRRLVLQFSPGFVHNWILAYSADAYRQVLQVIAEWEAFIYHPRLKDMLHTAGSLQEMKLPVMPDKAGYHDNIIGWLIREIIVPGRTINNATLLELLMQQTTAKAAEEGVVASWLYILQKTSTAPLKAPALLQQTAATLSTQYVREISVLQQRLAESLLSENQTAAAAREKEAKDAAGLQRQQQASARTDREQERQSEVPAAKKAENEVKQDRSSSVKEKEEQQRQQQRQQKEQQEKVQGTTESQSMPVEQRSADEGASLSSEKATGNVNVSNEGAVSPEPPAEGAVYYINNAGLILLHPYLSFFFDALGLREGKQFKDEAAQHRAVQLLGYLAHGEEDIPEYDLVLPKLLCGLQPAEPVRRFIPLTEAEKTETNELLTTLISHWNALGNTSPDGLRGNFLLREGKLEWKEEEWQLYVTQQAYDMLLNRLPWGFSVVGLSWMPWLIKTVWT